MIFEDLSQPKPACDCIKIAYSHCQPIPITYSLEDKLGLGLQMYI